MGEGPGETKKQTEKAKSIIPVYKKHTDASKDKLNNTAKKILKDALADIDKGLKV